MLKRGIKKQCPYCPAPTFVDEARAFEYLESVLWADGAVCPHCGALDRLTRVKANPAKRIRLGLWRCGHCKGQFTVKVGTVFEHARIPLPKALQAVYLMTSSKKVISAHQLHRVLEVAYKTAWLLAHRIREAMRSGDLAPFGGNGGIVEIDETFIGNRTGMPCAEKHLHRYLAEFDFRYCNREGSGVNDGERSVLALRGGASGRRLLYRDSSAA